MSPHAHDCSLLRANRLTSHLPQAKLSPMTLMFWARGLLIWGLVGLAASLGPALLLNALPGLDAGLLGLIAVMLTITVAPIAALSVSAGAILLLVALFRRGRS